MAERIELEVIERGASSVISKLEEIRSLISTLNGPKAKTVGATKSLESLNLEIQKLNVEAQKALHPTNDLFNNVKKFAQWYVIGNVISGISRNMREAVQEMKNVDTAMVTIQKVTGATRDEMDRMRNSAYRMAQELGTTASTLLKAEAEFAKAGYGDQAEELGKLAVMTAKVGDTTQETANQMLLSVDKAYQYNGSIEELTKVLDGANEIGNRFATDVEHIASGLGIIAPVANQAHVGVNELTAAIGTISAVTQRSGTEAARALRALFLNIIGDTKTEIDEGVTWTTGEIAGLKDVLQQYAGEAYNAAKASGQVVNPMEAIAGLSKSMKDGLLTEAQLMEMVSDIGGKLRTSQLLALIQNFDMYQQMLETYATSAGSAAEEYGYYLDSWEAKSAKLDATWASLVQNTVSSDFIKGLMDGANAALTFADNLGFVAIALGGLVLKFAASVTARKVEAAAVNLQTLASRQHALVEQLETKGADENTIATAKNTEEKLKNAAAQKTQKAAALEASKALTTGLSIAGAVIGVALMAWEAYNRAQEEARRKALEAAQATNEQVTALGNLKQQYLDIINSTATDAEKNRQLAEWKKTLVEQYGFEAEALRAVNEERYTGIGLINQEIQKQTEAYWADANNKRQYENAAREMTRSRSWAGSIELPSQFANRYSKVLENAGFDVSYERSGQIGDATQYLIQFSYAAENAQKVVEELAPVLSKYHTEMAKGAKLTAEEERALQEVQSAYNSAKNAIETYGSVFTEGNKVMAQSIVLDHVKDAATVNSVRTFNDYVAILREAAGENTALADAAEALANQTYPQFVQANIDAVNALFNTKGELTDAGESALNASDDFLALARQIVNTRLEAAQTKLDSLRTELRNTGNDALTAAAKFALFSDTFKALTGREMTFREINDLDSTDAQIAWADSYLNRLQRQAESLSKTSGGGTGGGIGGGTGGGTGTKSGKTPAQEELDRRKDIVAVEKNKLSLMEAQGAAAEEQIAQIATIQSALHNQAEQERLINGESAEALSLSKEWYEWEAKKAELRKAEQEARKQEYEDARALLESELSIMQKRGDSLDNQILLQREIQKNLHDEAEYLRTIGASQAEINELSAEWWDIENGIADDLEKLQSQRLSDLETVIDAILDKEKSALDATLEKYDAQLAALSAKREAKENELELEEKILAVQEAQAALANAQAERSVRYFNSVTGQWEWGVNAASVKAAQESLKSAKDSLKAFRDEQKYNRDVAEINRKKTLAQEGYDSLSATLTAALNAAKSVTTSTSTNPSVVKVGADGKAPKGLAVGTQVVTGGGTYVITGTSDSGYSSVLLDASKTTANTKFDSGGVLRGIGGIKATAHDEIVLPPDVAGKMLSPTADATFRDRLSELRYLYGADGKAALAGVLGRSESHDIYGGSYTIGGITIGETDAKRMTVYQLAQAARTLAIHRAV